MTPENVSAQTEHREGARTREADKGRLARLRVWWVDGGGDLVKGMSGSIACIGCLILAALWYGTDQAQENSARATAIAAREGCLRSKALGPSLALDYERRGVLTGENLALYRSLIPTTCPK